MLEAPVNRSFSRYILDGTTKNYNEYNPDAYISKKNISIDKDERDDFLKDILIKWSKKEI